MIAREPAVGLLLKRLATAEERKALLHSLAEPQQMAADDMCAYLLLDAIQSLQDELTPEESLAYLNRQYCSGDTIGTMLIDETEDSFAKSYITLLLSLIKKGLPAQKILEHLLIENYAGNTLPHLLSINLLVKLLHELKNTDVDSESLHHLLLKKNHHNESVLDRICKISASSPDILFRLLNEDVLPHKHYAQMAELIKPLLAYIDKLPEEEKKATHTLLMFADAATKKLTRNAIAGTQYVKNYGISSIASSPNRLEFITWLSGIHSLPLSMVLDCLNEKNKYKGDEISLFNLDACLSPDDVPAYIKLLLKLSKEMPAKKSLLTYVTRFNKHNPMTQNNVPIDYFHLLNSLLDDPEITGKHILASLKEAKININNLKKDQYTAYIAFLEKLSSRNTSHDVIIAIANYIYPLNQLIRYFLNMPWHEVKKETQQCIQYIHLLKNLALKEKPSEVASILASHSEDRNFVMIYMKNCAENLDCLLDLFITLKNKGVPTSRIHEILCYCKEEWSIYYPSPAIHVLIDKAHKDVSFLFYLLDNDLLPPRYYADFSYQKEAVFNYILTLPLKKRVKALLDATSYRANPHPLDLFMDLRRGFFPPAKNAGTFEKLHQQLAVGLLQKEENYINVVAELLMDCYKKNNQVDKKSIQATLVYLAGRFPEVLLKLLKHNMLPHSSYAEMAFKPKEVIKHISHLSKKEKKAVILAANVPSENNALYTFVNTHPILKSKLAIEFKTLFGDQQAIESSIKKAAPPAPVAVMPAQTGIQESQKELGASLRWHDEVNEKEDLQQRRLTAEKFPALYQTIYGEPVPREWIKKPEVVRPVTQQVEAPPPYFQAVASTEKPSAPIESPLASNSAALFNALVHAPHPPLENPGRVTTAKQQNERTKKREERQAMLA